MDNLKELQCKELEILQFFDQFCRKHNLTYYLAGGCLIGAERHAGFIPWDDDIDIFMPRPHYEYLSKEFNNEVSADKYVFCRTSFNYNYHDAGASIRDPNTTFINSHSINEDICHGVGIEIMPLDGCPNSSLKRAWQLFNASLFSLFNVQRLPDNKGKTLRTITKFVYWIVPFKHIRFLIWKASERQMSKYNWDECDYITELIGAIHGMLIKHPKSDFSFMLYKDFEGSKYPVMNGYKNYLRKVWGDYMSLPPVAERHVKHNAVKIDLQKSYKEYKGVYYCVKNN